MEISGDTKQSDIVKAKFDPGDTVLVKNNPEDGMWRVKSSVRMGSGQEGYKVLIVNENTQKCAHLSQDLLEDCAIKVSGKVMANINLIDDDGETEEVLRSSSPVRGDQQGHVNGMEDIIKGATELISDADFETDLTEEDFRNTSLDFITLLENDGDFEEMQALAGSVMADLDGVETGHGNGLDSSQGEVLQEKNTEIEAPEILHSTLIHGEDKCSKLPFNSFEETSRDFFIPLDESLLKSKVELRSPKSVDLKRHITQGVEILPQKRSKTHEMDEGSSTPGPSGDKFELKDDAKKDELSRLNVMDDVGGDMGLDCEAKGGARSANTAIVDSSSVDEVLAGEHDSFSFKNYCTVTDLIDSLKEIGQRKANVLDIGNIPQISEELVRLKQLIAELNTKKEEKDAAVGYQKEVGDIGGLKMDNLEEIWQNVSECLEKRCQEVESMIGESKKFMLKKTHMMENIRLLQRKQLALEPQLSESVVELEEQKAANDRLHKDLERQQQIMREFFKMRRDLTDNYKEDFVPKFESERQEAQQQYAAIMTKAITWGERIEIKIKALSSFDEDLKAFSSLLEQLEAKVTSWTDGKTSGRDQDVLRTLQFHHNDAMQKLEEVNKNYAMMESKLLIVNKEFEERITQLALRCRSIQLSLESRDLEADDMEMEAGQEETGREGRKVRGPSDLLDFDSDLEDDPDFVCEEEGTDEDMEEVEEDEDDVYNRRLLKMRAAKQKLVGRNLTDEEIDAIKISSDGQRTSKQKERLLARFKEHLLSIGEERPIKEIPNDILDKSLATFWYNYKRVTDGDHPDTGTLSTYFSRLNAALTNERDGRNPLMEPLEFTRFIKIKAAKRRLSKKVPGNGQFAHQADVLYPQELRYLLNSGLCSPLSAWGINRLLLIHLICGVSQRPILDQWRMPRDAVKITYGEKGEILFADITLQFDKRDTGDRIAAGRNPKVVPMADKWKCFFTALDNRDRNCVLLGEAFMEGRAPLFLEPRNTKDFSTNKCLFHPKGMSEGSIAGMIKNLCLEANLRIDDRIITNMSLRMLNFQHMIGLDITPEQGQTISNHLSKDTRNRYNRQNQDQMEVMGAAMMAATTGSPAILPEPAGVRAVKNLGGPLTCRDLPVKDIPDCTRLEVSLKRDTGILVENGQDVQQTLTKYNVTFDGEPKEDHISLYGGYVKHCIKKYEPEDRKEEFEEDMLRLCGEPHPDCPPLPVLGKQAVGFEIIPDNGKQRYTADGELTWRVERKALKEKKVNVPKKPKKVPEPVAVIQDGDLVFAREDGGAGIMWPAKVLKKFDESGKVSGYSVEYFSHHKEQTAILNEKMVKLVNVTAINKWGSPAMNKKSKLKKDSFATAMRMLEEELNKRGIHLEITVKEAAGEDKEN